MLTLLSFQQVKTLKPILKTLAQDKEFIKSKKIDALFIPLNSEIYPEGMSSDYDVGKLGQILCGITRPSHFNGVAQVVNRLLDIVKPNYSVFGQKDYQQLLIIKSLVKKQRFRHNCGISSHY